MWMEVDEMRIEFYGPQNEHGQTTLALPLALSTCPVVGDDTREGYAITVTLLVFTFAWIIWREIE